MYIYNSDTAVLGAEKEYTDANELFIKKEGELLALQGELEQLAVDAKIKDFKLPGDNLPPAGCLTWFDGCNTCKILDGKLDSCTEMVCAKIEALAKCTEYEIESLDL